MVTLKKLFVHCSHHPLNLFSFGGEIIENTGNIGYMFPWSYTSCNESSAGPLGCYSDSVLGFYDFGTIANCGLASEIVLPEFNFNLYPNPATEQLIIDNGQLIINEIEISDALGRVHSCEFKDLLHKLIFIRCLPVFISSRFILLMEVRRFVKE